MPCTDWPQDHSYEDTRKVDKLTKLLCEAVYLLDDGRSTISDGSEELQEWAQEHVLKDMDRLVAERETVIEKARQKWIKGLTAHEKKLMGL